MSVSNIYPNKPECIPLPTADTLSKKMAIASLLMLEIHDELNSNLGVLSPQLTEVLDNVVYAITKEKE